MFPESEVSLLFSEHAQILSLYTMNIFLKEPAAKYENRPHRSIPPTNIKWDGR